MSLLNGPVVQGVGGSSVNREWNTSVRCVRVSARAVVLRQLSHKKAPLDTLCSIYSCLNASFGSTLVALYAGMKQANIAIAISNSAIDT